MLLQYSNKVIKVKTLNNLTVGESCLIDKINIKGSMHRRFLDIGLVENTYVECVGESPSADPKAYLIRGAVIAIREEDAEKISVKKVKKCA